MQRYDCITVRKGSLRRTGRLNMKQNRLYDEFAYLWPLISPPEDYAREAKYWRNLLHAKLGPGQHHILELGVGGGHNLSHLTCDFKATAVDLSEKMLAISKKLNPDVEHVVGDMRSVRLGRTFDAVIIHDAIGYMCTEYDLLAAFKTAASHLKPGGIFITSPDYVTETYPGTNVSHRISKGDNIELTFIEYDYDPNPDDTTAESVMFYMILKNGRLDIEQDFHTTGLFPVETWLKLMEIAGFEVEMKQENLGEDIRQNYFFIGTKKR